MDEPAAAADEKVHTQAAPQNLTDATVGAVKWTYFAAVVTGVMQLVFTAIMGRLLDPAAFGLLAMSFVALNLSQHFGRLGVAQAIVQKLTLTAEEIRAAFVSGTAIGGLSAGVAWVTAPLVAVLFDEPQLTPVFRVMGLTLLVSGMGMTSESLLRREMRFQELAYRQMLSYAIGYLFVGISLALAGVGVWSLVAAAVVQTVSNAVICYARVRHPLRPTWSWGAYRPLYGFGARFSVIGVFEYLGENLDVLMVGRYASAALLGNYSRAFLLVNLPLQHLMRGLSKVLFSGMSQIQQDVDRLRRAYLSVASASAAIFLPLVAGIGVASREIVLVVLGDQWGPAAAILPLVAVAGALHVMTHFAGIVCDARAELNKKMLLQGAYVAVLALMLWLAVGGELWAYAAAFAAAKVLQQVAYMFLLRDIIAVQFTDFRHIYGRALIGAAATAGLIFVGRMLMVNAGMPVVVTLVVEVLLGALALVALARHGTLRPLAVDAFQRLQHTNARMRSGVTYRVARTVLGMRGE